MGKKRKGDCHLCGEYKDLTFEHVPPQSSGNNKPILIQKHEHLFDKKSFLFGKSIRSNRGAGAYYFCESCNNNTGDWYSRDFSDFVNQTKKYFDDAIIITRVNNIVFEAKPLNVLKQIITMFLAIEHGGILRKDKELVSFILDKNSKELPEKYQVYIYNTFSSKKRMYGIQYQYRNGVMATYSEITFEPFGYLLACDSLPPGMMTNITAFKNLNYNELKKFSLPLVFLKTDKMLLGDYE